MKSIVATNAKRIIKEKGLKQNFVAELMGYKPNVLSSMLNSRRLILDTDIINLCKSLKVTPNDLLLLREPPGKDPQPKDTKVS